MSAVFSPLSPRGGARAALRTASGSLATQPLTEELAHSEFKLRFAATNHYPINMKVTNKLITKFSVMHLIKHILHFRDKPTDSQAMVDLSRISFEKKFDFASYAKRYS